MRHFGKALTVAALAALAAPAIAQQPGATGMPGPSLGTPVPAPGAAQAPKPAQAAPLPKSRADAQPRQPYEIGVFSEWRVRCIRIDEAPTDPCEMGQVLKTADGSPTAEVSLFRLEREGVAAGASVVTPLETLLPRGVTLSIDGGQGKMYPFTFCNRQGCLSQLAFTAEDLAAMKKGSSATVTIYPVAAPDKPVSITMSLSGFTAAFDSLTGLPGIP